MEDEILDQMKTLDPELWGKYRISWENLYKRISKDTKPTKEEAEKGEASGLARAAGAPSVPPQETGKRAEKPGISKGKSEKPNMKKYLEKRAKIFEEAAIKKGQNFDIEEKLRKERDAAKRTPSLAVEPPHTESDYGDEYFSHLSSMESEEELELESERFLETEKILEKMAGNKRIVHNLPKTTQAGPAGRSHELPAKPSEGEEEIGKESQKNPIKG
ncbi:hypothetical protein JTB14_006002 [Gonioctena quinquepunctata]|nr:hypothetical protein JTB14_006002 [Gonioctena quinquepunctata]